MKKILFAILILSSFECAGQSHYIGAIGGINQTSITPYNIFHEHGYRTGISAGLTYNYIKSKNRSFGAALIFNQRGFTNDIVILDELWRETGERYSTRFNYDYVSIPIKATRYLGNRFFGFASIGLIPSFLIKAQTINPIIDRNRKLTESETDDVTNQVSKFDLAGLAEIGGGYKVQNRYWTYISLALQHSITTITNSSYFANTEIRHNGMTLYIGLQYRLSKK